MGNWRRFAPQNGGGAHGRPIFFSRCEKATRKLGCLEGVGGLWGGVGAWVVRG